VYNEPKTAYGFQNSVHIGLCYKITQEASRHHTESRKFKCSQHWTRRIHTENVQEA